MIVIYGQQELMSDGVATRPSLDERGRELVDSMAIRGLCRSSMGRAHHS